MPTTTQFTFKLSTGNLPTELAKTAKGYASKTETEGWKPDDGFRLSFVGYKVSKKAKVDEIQPMPFAVQVPVINPAKYIESEQGSKFLTGLMQDYQDDLIHQSADKQTLVNPTDWQAVIADYLDTSRTHGGLKIADLREWISDVFIPAFVARQVQLNETALADGRREKSDSDIEMLSKGYADYMSNLAGRTCTLGKNVLVGVRQALDKLVEFQHLDGENEEVKHFLSRIELLTKPVAEVLADAV